MSRLAVLRRVALITAAVAAFALSNSAALAAPADAAPPSPASGVTLPAVPTTRVLAIGRLTSKSTAEALRAALPREVEETVRLHLAGKIDQWFSRTDRPGVVFLFNVSDPAEARALLERQPLGRAGLMEFDFVPLGPLAPLGMLIDRPPP